MEIIRNRTITSTREPSSVFKIDITGIERSDTLFVNISHEKLGYMETYEFRGDELVKKKTLSFIVTKEGKTIKPKWRSTQPAKSYKKEKRV